MSDASANGRGETNNVSADEASGSTSVPDAQTRGGVSSWSIRRPIGTLALASVVVVLGFFFLDRLPVDLLPDVTYPQIRVTVNYPGTAPEVMEQQITRVLERNLAATENLSDLTSRASEGRTNVNLFFELGTDLDLALQDASRNLERARTQMPPDIEPPRIYKMDPTDAPVYEAGFSSETRSPLEVRDWLDNELAPQLLTVAGVGAAEVAGGLVREMQVIVDQERLAHYGLTVSEVSDAIAAENTEIAAGQVTSQTFDVMAKTDGLFESVEDIESILLTVPGQSDRIPLSEVADVRDTHQDQRLFVRLNGEPATRLSIMKLPDANTATVVDDVRSEIERLDQSGFIPADIQYEATTDQSFFVRSSLNAVGTAALLGGVLAMLVVLLFLGSFRKSFVIGLSIPIAILATFAMMGVGGLTLNVISLGGLALGVGLLLDNSIVMLENIARHREELKKSDGDAAHEGAREVASAVVASTMTNLAAVIPFLLITGLTALIFRELILTISFAIVASLAAALTLVPMGAALLSSVKYRSGLDTSAFYQAFNQWIRRVTDRYKAVLSVVLRYRWFVVGAGVALLAGTYVLTSDLGNEFLPAVDDGGVGVFVRLPPGTPPDILNDAAKEVEDVLMERPYIENMFAMTGGHLSGGVISERPGTARWSVQLVPATERDIDATEWVAETEALLDRLDLPGGEAFVSPPSLPGIRTSLAGSDVSVAVLGDDPSKLDDIGRQIIDLAGDIEGLTNFDLARDDQSPLLSAGIDRERAAALGLNVSEIGETLSTAVGGHVPTRFSTGSAEYDVRVMLPRSYRATADDLGGLLVFRPDGNPIPLREVADFSLGEGPAHITRENQARVARVNGDVNTGVTDVGTVNDQLRENLADLELPEGYSLIFGGEEEAIQETNRTLMLVTLLALFLVFVVMAVQYERLANPLVILTAVPLALIGVGAMLYATGTPLSAPVLLGVILLVGIVVNNAILLVEYIEIGREEQGLGIEEAAVEAGGIRFRPILMTTLTTVCGMLPLAIGIGAGAELMQPLALAVVGGLLVGMGLTLFVVPCLYCIIAGWADQLTIWITGAPAVESAQGVAGDGQSSVSVPAAAPAEAPSEQDG